MRLAGFGAGLAEGLTGGSSPCGKLSALGISHVKYNFPWAKRFASPHTPRTLFAHIVSVWRPIFSNSVSVQYCHQKGLKIQNSGSWVRVNMINIQG